MDVCKDNELMLSNNLLTVKLKGDLDHCYAEKIKQRIDDAIDVSHVKNLIFDFNAVKFMDSSGIGLIMGRYNKIRDSGGKIYVVSIGPAMDRIFRMAGLYKITIKAFDCRDVDRKIKGGN